MRLPIIFGVFAFALCACASEPSDFVAVPGAQQGGAATALNRCRVQSYSINVNAANTLLAAAYQQQFINDCMRASGYEMR